MRCLAALVQSVSSCQQAWDDVCRALLGRFPGSLRVIFRHVGNGLLDRLVKAMAELLDGLEEYGHAVGVDRRLLQLGPIFLGAVSPFGDGERTLDCGRIGELYNAFLRARLALRV